MKERKNVFISSTYVDLVEPRRAIWNLLNGYDVNIRGMESFGARKESPLETCLAELDLSDIYIGIIGMRFGSIEKNSQKSYTQLEYERALEKEKEILIYLIDEERASILIKNVDKGINCELLNKFKSILRDKHTVGYFINQEDLCQKLDRRMKGLLSYKKDVLNTGVEEEYNAQVLKSFSLMPKSVVGKEVKILISFKKEGYPLSKELCSKLGLSFGETMGVQVNIINPSLKELQSCNLIIENKNIDFYLQAKDDEEYEVTVGLLFLSSAIETEKASFNNHFKIKFVENPVYNPNVNAYGMFDNLSTDNCFIWEKSSKYIKEYETIYGEGFCALILVDYSK